MVYDLTNNLATFLSCLLSSIANTQEKKSKIRKWSMARHIFIYYSFGTVELDK